MMKNLVKKMVAMMLASAMVFSMTSATAMAEPVADELLEGAKLSKLLVENEEESRYEVTVEVPGKEGKHDEIIMLVDGSYSTDEEWEQTRAAILEIAEAVLDGSGDTQMTLLTFGMGDNIVVEKMKSVEELDAQLTELPGGLLYGRSSTNCEAGFNGIAKYLDANAGEINSANVIYITDGKVNTDETPMVFYNWKENMCFRYTPAFVANYNLNYYEFGGIAEGTLNASNAYKTVFGDVHPDEAIAGMTDEKLIAYADQVWEDVYAAAGLDQTAAYPVSVVERAFVSYDEANGTHVQDVFYVALVGRKYPEQWTRTPAAATALAAREDVVHLYLIDNDASSYANAHSWMKPDNSTDATKNVVGDNVTLTTSANVSQLLTTLLTILEQVKDTPYNDVTVTDYMSKWVNLDTESIKVMDGTICIWSSAEGWLIDEGRPTVAEEPVTITLVGEEDYDPSDIQVVGNTSGQIYRLDWKVKDGNLESTDNFRLVYEVTVDTEEEGFVYDNDYPSNGNTYLEYTDNDDQPQKNDITVPVVKAVEEETESSEEENESSDEVLGDSEEPQETPGDEVLGDNDSPDAGDANGLWTALAILGVISAAVIIPARRRSVR